MLEVVRSCRLAPHQPRVLPSDRFASIGIPTVGAEPQGTSELRCTKSAGSTMWAVRVPGVSDSGTERDSRESKKTSMRVDAGLRHVLGYAGGPRCALFPSTFWRTTTRGTAFYRPDRGRSGRFRQCESGGRDAPAVRVSQSVLKVISAALKVAKKPSEETMPDFSMYEGNYHSLYSGYGGEQAIRQWGNQLVSISLPSDDLGNAMTRLESDSDHKFLSVKKNEKPRDSWKFELAEDGKAARFFQDDVYWHKID